MYLTPKLQRLITAATSAFSSYKYSQMKKVEIIQIFKQRLQKLISHPECRTKLRTDHNGQTKHARGVC